MKQGIRELEIVMKSFEFTGKSNFVVDLSIVRGLDYYTGTVFETFLENYPELGSISSGGRYENLCSNYTDKKICGVGGSIGLSRLFVPLIENGIISEENISKNMIDVLILPQGENCYLRAFEIRNKILNETIYSTSIIYENKKFKKLMEYANKVGAKFVVIIGEDEVSNNTISIKNMTTGEQQTLPVNDALKMIK